MTTSESFVVRNRTAGHFQSSFSIDAAAISGRSVSAYGPAFDGAVAASVNVDTATLDGKAARYGPRACAVSYGQLTAVFNGYGASVVTGGIRIPSVSVKFVSVKINNGFMCYLETALISIFSAFGYILFKAYHLAFISEYSFLKFIPVADPYIIICIYGFLVEFSRFAFYLEVLIVAAFIVSKYCPCTCFGIGTFRQIVGKPVCELHRFSFAV